MNAPTPSRRRNLLCPLACVIHDLLDAEPSQVWTLRRLALQLRKPMDEVGSAVGELISMECIVGDLVGDRAFFRAKTIFAEFDSAAAPLRRPPLVERPAVPSVDQEQKLRRIVSAQPELFAGVEHA